MKRETEILRANADILRETLIGVFGLHAFIPKHEREAAREAGEPVPFVPGAFVFGNHHLLKHLSDEQKKGELAHDATNGSDAAFEQMSARLAQGDYSDMDPFLVTDMPVQTPEQRQAAMLVMLRQLGVTDRPADAPEVPHHTVKTRTQQRPRITFRPSDLDDNDVWPPPPTSAVVSPSTPPATEVDATVLGDE